MNIFLLILTALFGIIRYIIFNPHLIIYMYHVPRLLHIMQLEGYQNQDYIRWISKNPKKAFGTGITQLIACGGFYISLTIINYFMMKKDLSLEFITVLNVEVITMLIVFTVTNIIQIVRERKEQKNAKKKLNYTPRAKRLMVANFCVMILLHASFIFPLEDDNTIVALNLINEFAFYSLFIALIPINMLFANLLAYPTEKLIGDHYIFLAKMKLLRKPYRNMIRIGITGSYGKTSTKYILKTILSEKYKVQATPGSYNTTMGNVKFIRKEITPDCEVFISEMGARHKGDIAEICNFVHPQIGLITSIGPQHLETFKTIDRVVKTKAELIDSLPLDGVVVLPRDNEYCQKLYQEEKRKKYCYTMKNKNADVYAKDIVLNENGSNFTAVTNLGEIKCVTCLLGEHNIQNILGAIAIAVHLGLTVEEIERGVRKIEPVPHRLQILNNQNGTIVIDDAFNSNPVGAKMALDVLKSFHGRRIIITPGMVELGEAEYKENKKFGSHMADCVDIAILVGMKRSKPIVEGLKERKFDDMNIHVVASLESATSKLAEISQVGDVILFENDLPDSYNE